MAWIRKPAAATQDLTSVIEPGWQPGTVTARRAGNVVTVDVQAISRTEVGTGTVSILALPLGYRPAANLYGTSFRGYRTRCLTGGALAVDAPGLSVDYLHFTFITADPMPKGAA
ncbi:MAG: hypothetical protein ACTH6N_04590 [Brachybacterium tyrofermentans]|uniref:hypothetical protein n=1 Tax=Brachybacterium tyrofermentans TaxID=47848 RepID=UPI001865D707|nr:hypothetical protein [Brachybacterium tyrofermentans]